MLMLPFYYEGLNDRGVSESIGFILIFGIVIAGIALVTLYGYPLLLQQQQSADVKIMEKNMIVLQNDIKSLAYKTVPFKETSLKIGGGSLKVFNSSYDPPSSNPSTFTISDAANIYVDKFNAGELRYESVSAQVDISLQNGAVVMRPRNAQGSTMLAEPRWFYDQNTKTMVINLINITSINLMAKEGIGTVQMTLGETNYTYISPVSSPVSVKYEYDPNLDQDYSVAWDNYFTNTLGMTPNGPDNYEQADVNTLVIKKYEVQIKNI
jgi:hypothetical protein